MAILLSSSESTDGVDHMTTVEEFEEAEPDDAAGEIAAMPARHRAIRARSRTTALRVHRPAGVVPAEPFQRSQQSGASGDVSAGLGLKARDWVGARGLGWHLIVSGLGAGTSR